MPTPRSSTSAVYGQVRADILAGRLRPGERLPFAVLSSRYDISVGALREVLMRLSEQGLVVNEPQQGFSVISISRHDLAELTDLRCVLEGLTARRAVAEGDLKWEANLVYAHHVMMRTPRYGPDGPPAPTEEWAVAHAEFHQALLDGCANTRMKTVTRSVRASAELYRRWASPIGRSHARDIDAEHKAILDSALARDAERCAQLVVAHITLTTELLLESMDDSDTASTAETDDAP